MPELGIDSPHSRSVDEVVEAFKSSADSGLTDEEATKRRAEYGPNKLTEREQKSIWAIAIDQLKSPVMYLLMAAAALSFSLSDIPEGIAIVAVLLVNAAIGFTMELQARKSMEALKAMDRIMAKVIRNGEEVELDAEELVPGDMVLLSEGRLVPADLRLIESAELKIDESALTGESVPVEKEVQPVEGDTQVADRSDMAFKGTSVSMGKAKGMVIATGMDTELGNISDMVSSAGDEQIPLNKKLGSLTKKLIWLVLGLAVAYGAAAVLTDRGIIETLKTSLAWAIAAIPEGLPIVASLALSRGMLRLAKRNVIVKRLASVETLGETNLIFTDKTGTLTENRLTVDQLVTADSELQVNWHEKERKVSLDGRQAGNDIILDTFLKIATLCNNATFHPEAETENSGDPLEIGLLRFGHYLNREKKEAWEKLEKVAEDPFDSESMMMGTVHQTDGGYLISAKGSLESILNICHHKLTSDGIQELQEEDKKRWLAKGDELAADGLRTLAFAYRETESEPAGIEEGKFLNHLTLVALVGFLDPPREQVPEAVQTCKRAGIEVIMVTGDHPKTAESIARKVCILDDGEGGVIHGKELGKQGADVDITHIKVFSRVNPAQKLQIIERFQKANKITGMTGDGVNDAPALKKADIGIAMGKRGTQVAKEVADMVLKDDAFPSIVEAIREGRIIFSNIRRFVVYQISYHLSEIIVIAAASFSLFTLPLLPLQLLFLNILVDVFPALALGIGEGSEDVMKQPPKDPEEPILHKASWGAIIVYGVIIALCVGAVYFYGHYKLGLSDGITNNIAFFALALAQLLHVFNMRQADEPLFNNQITRNLYVWLAIILCAGVLVMAYLIPGLNQLLDLEPMSWQPWLLVVIGGISPVIVIQVVKEVLNKINSGFRL